MKGEFKHHDFHDYEKFSDIIKSFFPYTIPLYDILKEIKF